jgi:2-polyprenyl-6-hydroxyphenyl methylase/3-demethylubiquinone-9 3-methyltransferase
MTSPDATAEPSASNDLSIVPCKCCGAPALVYGAVDFHRSCEDRHAPVFEPAGVDIPYHRCGSCGFLFTIAFDHFTPAQFSAFIYNDAYPLVDPDFDNVRPRHNEQLLLRNFGEAAGRLRVLDYGGGTGLLAKRLREQGVNADSYDPFYDASARPHGQYDLVTAFEVMEHTTTPYDTLQEMASFVRPDGLLLFSTLVQPAEIDELGLRWWYAAPRNGHVSLYSHRSLAALGERLQMATGSCGDLIHVAVRSTIPAWASALTG